MKLEVTRDVVSDLWPLCRSGDASDASRVLVRAYLAEDVEFARRFEESEGLARVVPHLRLSPDAERHLLDEIRGRAHTRLLLTAFAVGMAGLVLLVLTGGALFAYLRLQ
jgi:ferric-dicitrate binding protein FerR (iron transport regulator)